MVFSSLAPRLAPLPVASMAPRSQSDMTHEDSDWAVMYPEIERLYVHENQKLRHVMQTLERKHGFKATTTMYKKRLAKWGFRKYTKRRAAAAPSRNARNMSGRPRSAEKPDSVPMFSGLSHDSDLNLRFLSSVRTWSVAFFEYVQLGDDGQFSTPQRQPSAARPRSLDARETNYAFKLVVELMDRGHGQLAGRMARKAFLLIEDMLTLDGPALIWNLLEMMHHMVMLRHERLFQMLLTHLNSLVAEMMPDTHPLATMLRTLQQIVADLRGSRSNIDVLPVALPFMLEQAWVFNAKMLFEHFNPKLIRLYWCIFWDTCSINLPSSVVEAVIRLLSQIETSQKVSAAAKAYLMDATSTSNPVELLHASSIAALRERRNLILGKSTRMEGDTNTILALLAGLVTANILGERPAAKPSLCAAECGKGTMKVSGAHAVTATCAIRNLMDPSLDCGISDAVSQTRMIVALRECTKGETDPQVVREIWALEDALTTAGEIEKAQEIRAEALRRVERYLQEIPMDSADNETDGKICGINI